MKQIWTSSSRPVFVVGPSRSGTALLRSVLNLNDAIHLAGETHYFDDLRPRLDNPGAVLSESQRTRVRDYFLALSHRRYGFGGESASAGIDAELLDAFANVLGGSADAYFEAFCRLFAEMERDPEGEWTRTEPSPDLGPARWGEKTPRHVFRIGDVVAAFPEAQVIAMVRDPRAVVASYANWRTSKPLTGMDADPTQAEALAVETTRARRSFHPVIASLMCRGAITSAEAARSEFGDDRVKLVRYESLTEDAPAVLRNLSEWLGITFSDSMLEAPVHNSSFDQVEMGAGIRRRSADRWREVLTPAEVETVQVLCGPLMARWSYDKVDSGCSRLELSRQFASTPVAVIRAGGANRDRIASLPDYVRRRLMPGSARS